MFQHHYNNVWLWPKYNVVQNGLPFLFVLFQFMPVPNHYSMYSLFAKNWKALQIPVSHLWQGVMLGWVLGYWCHHRISYALILYTGSIWALNFEISAGVWCHTNSSMIWIVSGWYIRNWDAVQAGILHRGVWHCMTGIKAKNNERKSKKGKIKKGKQKIKWKKKKGKAEASAVSNLRPPAYNAPTCKNRGKIKKRKKMKMKI
jgi:hypothetical protein